MIRWHIQCTYRYIVQMQFLLVSALLRLSKIHQAEFNAITVLDKILFDYSGYVLHYYLTSSEFKTK